MSSGKALDYRRGLPKKAGLMRGFALNLDGAAVLFETEARMRVLAAVVGRTATRMRDLDPVVGSNHENAVKLLIAAGVLTRWSVRRGYVCIALDPAHPAFPELHNLLLKIRATYRCYGAVTTDQEVGIAGWAPVRRSRRRDATRSFGSAYTTLILLLAHALDGVWVSLLELCLPFERRTISRTLWKFHAFGLLKMERSARNKKKAEIFRFNPDHPLTTEVRAVLSAVNLASPLWVTTAQRIMVSPAPSNERRRRTKGRFRDYS